MGSATSPRGPHGAKPHRLFLASDRARYGPHPLACEPACPVEAIFYADDVPAEWSDFTAWNAEFFQESVTGLGDPGGAAAVGATGADHPKVAALEIS